MTRLPQFHPPERERGAALLSVLLLVAVMAVIAAVMLERLNLATHLAGNGQAMAQARLYATSAESLAMARIKGLLEADQQRTVDRTGLLGREFPLPLVRGVVRARIDDADNCFNVNSLVEQAADGRLALRPAGLSQLRALMKGLAVPENEAVPVSDAIADWIDSDDVAQPNGAEDDWYRAQPVPYRTAGRLIGDVSELRAVKGMTATTYARLRPWLCALPAAQLSPININTLRIDQARLLAMLAPQQLPIDRVRGLIAARPPDGWADAGAVLQPFSGGNTLGPVPLGQLQVRSRWFLLTQSVQVDSVEVEEQALIDSSLSPPRVAFRSWGDRDSR
ncbi:type II secretion system minor pseudopilin GspK [Novosphingobium lentum]|uniref:type II secretion system minor pseudopilin GspK n=1 Tax=Novosphingobium lentum TaxID=145287 RepID=UPI00082E2DEA|nr:type II secretion system minor pseudopilin GspK [Novosphingobium lentum]